MEPSPIPFDQTFSRRPDKAGSAVSKAWIRVTRIDRTAPVRGIRDWPDLPVKKVTLHLASD